MDLLTYASSDDEEVVPSINPNATSKATTPILHKFKASDPRRNSSQIDLWKADPHYFNPKLIDNWNQQWNLELHGTNCATNKNAATLIKGVQALVEEAQQHTQDVSEGKKMPDGPP